MLELDELRSFVGSKACQLWLWVALCRRTRQIVAWNLGDRSQQSACDLQAILNPHAEKANLLPEERGHLRDFLAREHPIFGDRKSEVTVIGTARDRGIFLGELRACLCTDGETARWRQDGAACGLSDPWPQELRKVGA